MQALRAGTVDRDNPYRFALPSNWRENQVTLRRNQISPFESHQLQRINSWRGCMAQQLNPIARRLQVANIQSGNYCQPRCAEPWTEVIFSDPAEGKVQVPKAFCISFCFSSV